MSQSSADKNSHQQAQTSTKNASKINKLFITNISSELTSDEIEKRLKTLFQKYAAVVRMQIKKNFNQSYSFAFVEFASPEAAAKVLKQCNRHEINGKNIFIDFQRSNPRQGWKQPQINRFSNHERHQKQHREEKGDRDPSRWNNQHHQKGFQDHPDPRRNGQDHPTLKSHRGKEQETHRKDQKTNQTKYQTIRQQHPKEDTYSFERKPKNQPRREIQQLYCASCKHKKLTNSKREQGSRGKNRGRSSSQQRRSISNTKRHERSRKDQKHHYKNGNDNTKNNNDRSRKHRYSSSSSTSSLSSSSSKAKFSRKREQPKKGKYERRSNSYSRHRSRGQYN